MNIRAEITASAAEVLEPNLPFYRQDPSDEMRYFVGPEVLEAIAWVATSVALPILLSAGNEIVKNAVGEWFKKYKEQDKLMVEPPVALEKELATILESKGGIAITSDQVADAVDAVTDHLSYRGWPKAFARSDASEIVEIIRKKVATKS